MFPYRESNPGLVGESHGCQPLHHMGDVDYEIECILYNGSSVKGHSKYFPYRESNPGLVGESHGCQPLHHMGDVGCTIYNNLICWLIIWLSPSIASLIRFFGKMGMMQMKSDPKICQMFSVTNLKELNKSGVYVEQP